MDIHDGSLNTTPTTPASVKPPSVIYDTSAHPDSPPCYHLRSHVKEIFKPPSAGQPRYDSSNKPASKRQIFPLAPLPFTTEPSPKKSSESLPGFIAHATSTNAFSATASSSPLSFEKSSQPDEEVKQLFCFLFHMSILKHYCLFQTMLCVSATFGSWRCILS